MTIFGAMASGINVNHWCLIELPYWFKAGFFFAKNFTALEVQQITLRKVRFNLRKLSDDQFNLT